jgi:hypothetical protein
MHARTRIIGWFVFVIALINLQVEAQWMTQTVELKQGWNAVFLTVQPVPASCDAVFADAPVERVTMWNRVKGGTEYISDVSEELPRPSDWLVWRPASNPESRLNSLSMLMAGSSYLINMSAPATLNIKGRAVLVHPEWLPNEMTLTGVPTAGGVNFADWFRHSDEIGVDAGDGGAIYEIRTDGSEFQVYRPSVVDIKTGEAYWIKTGQVLNFDGSLGVTLDNGEDWIDFGSDLVTCKLRLKNNSGEMRTVSIEVMDSESAPSIEGGVAYPDSKGPVPLSRIAYSYLELRDEYIPMAGTFTTNLSPHSSLEIELMPRIDELVAEDAGAVWESILKVSDGEVMQYVGVSCEQEDDSLTDPAGLWVGTVAVDAVSRAAAQAGGSGDVYAVVDEETGETNTMWNTKTPLPVSRPYAFRVLMHVSTDGTCRLLQRAFPSIVPGNEDDDEPVARIFTDAQYARQFKADHSDAEVVRISSANFPMMDPLVLTGAFGGTETVSGNVHLPFNDPVNPFVHAFHPDHDNKEYRNGVATNLAAGVESFTVDRAVKFSFVAEDPFGVNPRWQVDETGGVYEETVIGLNKTIHVSGAFRLEKVSDCGVLSYLK